MKIIIQLAIFIAFLTNVVAGDLDNHKAVIYPEPLAHNDKIATFVYKPDYIYKYMGTYEYQSHIKLEQGEKASTIAMGNSSGWEIVHNGNRIFLRPLNKYAKTNMTLITNKRMYQFLLDAKNVDSMDDPAVFFETRFVYPDDISSGFKVLNIQTDTETDFSDPSKYNFNYSYNGPEKIAPVKIFDDGQFTYFEFPERNAEIPAIFYVDSDGYEGLVNYRVQGNYIVVERLSDVFTLRHGTDTICVFNDLTAKEK